MFPYMGGKSKQSKWIEGLFPENFNKYVEVFGGAFWVYIMSRKIDTNAVYNDIDPMMYNLWLCIKEYDTFIPILENMEPNNKDIFIDSRKKVRELMETVVKITKPDFDIVKPFIYWQTHSFSGDINGGMSKVNNHIGMLNRLKKTSIQRKLDKITVENLSYDNLIEKYDNEDVLFYVDPPYYGREHFYGFHPFTVDDHEKLSLIIKNMKGKSLISYYRKPEIEELYSEDVFVYVEKEYKRSSSSVKQGTKKEKAVELIIKNF